jgi:hypothetical protein
LRFFSAEYADRAGRGVGYHAATGGLQSKGFVMADKKKPAARKTEPRKTTPKRRTAIPVSAARTASKAPVMRIVAPPEVIEPTHDAIARRAFENWMFYLRLANDPIANWLEAEQQLRRESNAQ